MGIASCKDIDGKNLRIEYRSTEGDESRLPELAAELNGSKEETDNDDCEECESGGYATVPY